MPAEALPGACEYVAWECTQPWLKPTQKEIDAVAAARAAQAARVAALAAAAPAPAAPAAEEPAAEEDEGDLWGDDDDDEEAEAANEARLAAVAEAHKQKKIAAGKLKVVVGLSKIVLDVKPWDDATDMKELEKLVRSIKHPKDEKFIDWQAGELTDIGYGIKKLRIMVQVYDDEVSVDEDLVEVIQDSFADHVQSCDIFAFNKV